MYLVRNYAYQISFTNEATECALSDYGLSLEDIYYHMVKSFRISD